MIVKAWAALSLRGRLFLLALLPLLASLALIALAVRQQESELAAREHALVRASYMDARRFANKQGLTLKGPTKVFWARPANAGMLYAQKHGVFRVYNDLAFDRFWRRELDPEDVAAVSALLVEAGAPQGFASFLEGEGGPEHDRLRAEAEASGIFGVPTFVFNGEMFWGGDRIGLLRERFDEKGVRRRPD